MPLFRAVRIDDVGYVYDPNINHYACSLTPARWLEAAFCDCAQNTDDRACECCPENKYFGTEVDNRPFAEIEADDLEEAREFLQGNYIV